MTMTLVSTVTVGVGGAASIEFTGIPQTGQDLMVVLSGRGAETYLEGSFYCRFNGTTSTTNYSAKDLRGTGSAASSSVTNSHYGTTTDAATASTFGNVSIYVPNYAGANNKSFSIDATAENNSATAYIELVAGLWAQTAAITSVSLIVNGGFSLQQYSTASLYTISTTGATGATVA